MLSRLAGTDSFKNELGVKPGSLIDISLKNTSNLTIDFFNKNQIVIKKLGRVNNILKNDPDKGSATLVINGEMFKLYFDQDIDLNIIKNNLTKKHSKIKEEMNKINIRLNNKSFTDKAPIDIVEQEKTNFDNLEKDAKKLELTLESL